MRIAIIALTLLVTTISCSNQETTSPSNKNQTPLEKLVAGNQRFLEEKSIHPHQNKKSVLDNQNGQHPFAVILTCSDSRVPPEILFDQGIGDLFVIRNAGNLISDIELGSIEYAVEHLDVELIVVLGHTECGAIKAYVDAKNDGSKKHHNHIDDIVEMIAGEPEEKVEAELHPQEPNMLGCINANIVHSTTGIENSAIIKKHKTQVVSMRYDVHTGTIVPL